MRRLVFSPNPVLFAKKFVANDGHWCDSLAEKIIDDWLFSRKIEHKVNFPYPNARFTVDFKVKDVYIEFFGLKGQLKSYDRLMKQKMQIIKRHHIKLLSIYPKDLFPNCRLKTVLKSIL